MHIRRAAVPVPAETDTPSSSLALLPLMSISVLVFILLFFSIRMFKRSLHLPSLTWLRGKGKGAKRTLGLSGVELLPTSLKSIPTPSPSPYAASFNIEGNAGKDGSTSLLSRSSSLDGLPQFIVSSPPPPSSSPRHLHSRSPFKLPEFFTLKRKPLHRRSKSLGEPIHQLAPPATFSLIPGSSAPSTPSPQTLLIDFSTSNSSTSTSSDLGTHKFPAASPLIPGLPIPVSSPILPTKSKSHTFPVPNTHVWVFDQEDNDDGVDFKATDPLFAAFKRSQHESIPKSQLRPEPLIQYERSSSPALRVPTTPNLVPKRLGTNNPFASLSSASPLYIQQRPLSPSPLSLSPSSPPGIELVSVRSAPADIELVSIAHTVSTSSKPANLVNFDADEELDVADASRVGGTMIAMEAHETPVISLPRLPRMDAEEHDIEEAHDVDTDPTHVENTLEAIEARVDLSTDPFDDSNAVSHSEETWDTYPAAEHAYSSPAQPLVIVSAPPSPVTTAVTPVLPTPSVAESSSSRNVSPEPESKASASSWQWDDAWTSAPLPASQHISRWPLDPAPLAEIDAEARDVTEAREEKEDDLISFDRDNTADSRHHVIRNPVATLDVDADAEMDPADAWFIEEPTAVWDTVWDESEDVKGGSLFDMGPVKRQEEHGREREQEVQVRFLDQLLAGPSTPVAVHVFEEQDGKSLAADEPPHTEDQEDEAYDFNDTHDMDNHITTNIITNAAPSATATTMSSALTTPTTPNTPLPALPPHTPLAIFTSIEEHPDPDLLPLPDLPLSSLPASPMPLSPSPIKPPSPSRSLSPAQTPTPPASPPPTHHVPTRPLWSLRASDAPPLGLPAFTAVVVPAPVPAQDALTPAVPEPEPEAEAGDEVEGDTDTASIQLASSEETTVTVLVSPPADEPEEEKHSPTQPFTPQPALSTSLPGSFPSSPAQPAVSLPTPAPAHLPLLPRAVASTSSEPSTTATATATAASSTTSTSVLQSQNRAGSNRLLTPRSALDLALAMQLRPGLGAGADPAWMVRFLMALFGWVAVLVSGDM